MTEANGPTAVPLAVTRETPAQRDDTAAAQIPPADAGADGTQAAVDAREGKEFAPAAEIDTGKPKGMPPLLKRMPPPKVPKFGAPAPAPAPPPEKAEQAAHAKARRAALAAASAAAKSALPAQRDRAVAEAAAAAYAAHKIAEPEPEPEPAPEVEAEDAAEQPEASSGADAVAAPKPKAKSAAPRDAASYEPPQWSGIPTGVEYTLEEIKGGSSLAVRDVGAKAFYTLGRTPNNDIVLEHPSSSRLHAVLQYHGETRAAFLYDAGSAHGTFLNRRRIKPGMHVPIRVGDMVKFGQSTRDLLFGGPSELMPEEGLSKTQRHELRLLKAKEKRRERDAAVGAELMEAAIGSGASWGFGEEALDEGDEVTHVDWRAYSETRGLTDKQDKIATKIRKKETTIRNLTTETERIRAKGQNEELTAGQAATLARNERTIDVLKEELEDLEETLNESVADSIKGRRRAADGEDAARAKAKARRKKAREEEEEYGSSDNDEFYDRTVGAAVAVAAGGGGPSRKRAKKAEKALDAGGLFAQVEALKAEETRLQQAISLEQAAQPGGGGQTASDGAAADYLQDGAAAPAAQAQGGDDALDAFMSSMAQELEADKEQLAAMQALFDSYGFSAQVGSLRKELAAVQKQLTARQALLKVADPDGFFTAGSAAAKAASARAAKEAALEKERAAARERQRLARLAEKQREAELAARSAEDIEEQEEDAAQPMNTGAAGAAADSPDGGTSAARAQPPAQAAGGAPAQPPASDPPAGLEVRRRAGKEQPAAAIGPSAPAVAVAPGSGAGVAQHPEAAAAPAPAVVPQSAAATAEPSAAQSSTAGLQIRPKRAAAAQQQRPAQGGEGRLLSRTELQAARAADTRQAAVDDDLDVLARARRGSYQPEQDEEAGAVWQPPTEQKGDGRTSLNDKYGY